MFVQDYVGDAGWPFIEENSYKLLMVSFLFFLIFSQLLPTPNSNPHPFDDFRILPFEFFQVDALDLAPRLLDKFLKKDDVVLQITEVMMLFPSDSSILTRWFHAV